MPTLCFETSHIRLGQRVREPGDPAVTPSGTSWGTSGGCYHAQPPHVGAGTELTCSATELCYSPNSLILPLKYRFQGLSWGHGSEVEHLY